jgi:hypothetical protein
LVAFAGCNALRNDRCDCCNGPSRSVVRKKPAPDCTACVSAKCKDLCTSAPAAKDFKGPVNSAPVKIENGTEVPKVLPNLSTNAVVEADKAAETAKIKSPSEMPVVVEPLPAAPTTTKTTAAIKNDVSAESPAAPLEEATPMKEHVVVNKSVHIHYGHGVKFESITGKVEGFRKTWRLRYAPIDQEDTYGGVVILEGNSELRKLRDDMHVRVRGTLIPPTDRNGVAHYRVDAVEILD